MSNETANKAKLFAKVVKVMQAVRTLPKDGENKFDKYNYITGDAAFERIGGIMASVGLAILPSVVEVQTEDGNSQAGKTMFRTVIHGQITLADSETGETWTSEWYGEGADRSDKSINKAMTAMMKYYLLRLFMVGSGEDADEESPEVTKQPAQKPQPQRTNASNTPSHRQPEASTTPASNGNGLAISGDYTQIVSKFKTPQDAWKWAADNKLTDNEHSAQTRWTAIVKEKGGYTPAKFVEIATAYVAHYSKKQEVA